MNMKATETQVETVLEGEVVNKEVKQLPAERTENEVAVQNITPLTMLNAAVQKGTSMDQLEKLMSLHERWEANEARKAFVKALAAFKANPPDLFKNKKVRYENRGGDVTEYKHASLDQVSNTIGAELSKHGLSHRWDVEQKDSFIKVTCVLTHEMGHSEKVPMQSNPDASGGKNSIQAIASAITYLERYTLLAATGMAVQDMDDDGKNSEKKEPELLTEIQRKIVNDYLGNISQAAQEKFVDTYGEASLITRDKFDEVVERLKKTKTVAK